jgi:ORF6N domain
MKRQSSDMASIDERIHTIRGQKVLLDSDLASLYGVSTKVLLQAVRRNYDRFPDDFLFHLSDQELRNLRSQFGEGSGNSVDLMAVAGDGRPQANECGGPQQQGAWIGAGATAAQHLA